MTANAVFPTTDTRMMDSIPAERRTATGTPEQIAPAVAWLVCPESGWRSGQILALKGDTVTLYSVPRPVARIRSEHGWDEESLADAAEVLP